MVDDLRAAPGAWSGQILQRVLKDIVCALLARVMKALKLRGGSSHLEFIPLIRVSPAVEDHWDGVGFVAFQWVDCLGG